VFLAACSSHIANAQPVITTVAGADWVFPGDTLAAVNAPFGRVSGVAVDPIGNVYVSDAENRMVMRIDRNGMLSIVAGNGVLGFAGDGGPARRAALLNPHGVSVDAQGNLYFIDGGFTLPRIRKVDTDGTITTVAGGGRCCLFGDGGPAVEARVFPHSIAVDPAGNIYITESNRIRRVTTNGIITTIAGNELEGYSGDGGPAIEATLSGPAAVAADTAGNVFIADTENYRIRKIAPSGIITTVAGNGEAGTGVPNESGPATEASLGPVIDLTIDQRGNLYLADSNDLIRKITPAGTISTIARAQGRGFSGDGGPASAAQFSAREIAVDAMGNLYLNDEEHDRIRRIDPQGIITTFAGNGLFHYSGEGRPAASSALNGPHDVALDDQGNLYISEGSFFTTRYRIRKVTSDGLMHTAVGTGEQGLSASEGTPAVATPIGDRATLSADSLGNLFYSEWGRVRRVSAQGVVHTVAGSGSCGTIMAGGPALNADLCNSRGIVLDAQGSLLFLATSRSLSHLYRVDSTGGLSILAGQTVGTPFNNAYDLGIDGAQNLYVVDIGASRVLQVTPTGAVSVVAGNGERGNTGDGGPATQASLYAPVGIATAEDGSFYVSDGFHTIRRVTADGIIDVYAGSRAGGFFGDGGPATQAQFAGPNGMALDSLGNLYIADSLNDRVRVVLAEPPAFLDSFPEGLDFRASSGGPPAPVERIAVANAVANVAFSAQTDTTDGGDWLRVTPLQGTTPRLLEITADPADLAPGQYQGRIVVNMPVARPNQREVAVRFDVTQAIPPELRVDTRRLSFTYPLGTAARSEALTVTNAGGGVVSFSISATTQTGGAWLSADVPGGQVAPVDPARIHVTADPRGLPAATYRGTLAIADSRGSDPIFVPVNMTVSELDQAILLSQRGLSFTAVAGGGVIPTQTFGVINVGRGSMDWTTTTSTLAGGDWLRASPALSSSTAGADAPLVEVTVDYQGLAPGGYHGLVEVRSNAAANSPQVVTVFLEVQPPGSDPGPLVVPSELVFTAAPGGASPSSQDLLVYNVTADPRSFRSSRSTDNGGDWLTVLPGEATIDPQQPTRIVVQPFVDSLGPGSYRANLTLQFLDGTVRGVAVTLLVGSGASHPLKGNLHAQTACTPTQLFPALRTLGNSFSVSAGWPVGLRAEVFDDCGSPLEQGAVTVEFSNGDPEIPLTPLLGGRWDGTWQTGRELLEVSIRVRAQNRGRTIQGLREISGRLRSLQEPPLLTADAVVSAASFLSHEPLGPGSLVSLFGQRLAEGLAAAERLPLETTLAGTVVTIAGRRMPLLFSSEGQINAIVPYGLNVNTRHQVLVRRGDTYAQPVSVDVATSQPAVFPAPQPAAPKQGHIYKVDASGAQVLASPASPASPGDVLVIYCSGLGPVGPAVKEGEAAPLAEPLARTVQPVSVMIGGLPGTVLFAGLAPGFAGLYQINVAVSRGVEAGDQVPATVQVGGQTSTSVTLALR
jgi:uncharacterized protein (TIGR03437 family)